MSLEMFLRVASKAYDDIGGGFSSMFQKRLFYRLEEEFKSEKEDQALTRQISTILRRSGMDKPQPKRTFKAYDQAVRSIYKSNKMVEDI